MVVVQLLNPKPQHQPYGVEVCPKKATLAPVAELHLHPPGLVLIFFIEKMGCSCPTYLVSLKTNKNVLPWMFY